MNKFLNETRVVLIGGSSHTGKSTLSYSLATRLDWDYLSTDSLARHPGRPWTNTSKKSIPKQVVEHYESLSVEALFSDVLSHYENNILPQVEAIVSSRIAKQAEKCLILEGSALYPKLVANLVARQSVKAIWLTASERFLKNRIELESNFDNANSDEKYLIMKFIARTLLYDKRMKDEINNLGFNYIDVEHIPTTKELLNKCLQFCC